MNKKLILTLILGMFLFGTVNSLSITVEEPFETPTLNSVTNETGGSWEAGNYNFRIYTDDHARTTPGRRRSPSSNTINLDVSAGNKLTFNYSIPSETEMPIYFSVIFQKDGGRWKYANLHNSISTYPSEYTILSPYETTVIRFTILDNYEYFGTSMWGLNTTRGVGRVRITGSSGSLTNLDIINALKNSSLIEGEDYILGGDYSAYGTFSLWFDTTGGTIDISGSKFDLFGGIYSPNSNTLITATPSVYGVQTELSSPQRGGYISGVTINNISAEGLIIGDSFKDYNSLSGYHQTVLSGDIKASFLGTQYASVPNGLSFGSIYYSVASARFWDTGDYRDLKVICNFGYLNLNGGNIYDTTIYAKLLTYQIFWLTNNVKGINLYDVDIIDYNTGEKYNYDELIFYDYNLYGKNTSIKFLNSINLKIIEENGTVIPNANVTVKNKNGDIVINTTTDENGEISEYIQTFQHNNINEEGVITGGGYNTDFNPFTIQISKQGYKTLEFEETISGKKDWTLSLNEEEQSITPASLIVDKIISVESLNSSFIVYNITNKIVNRGGSLAKNVILFDSDSNQTEYYLGNLTRGNMTRISYLKGFQRNSTTYDVNLVVSRVEGNDSYLEEKISENSSEISLIVPSSTANSTLTLIKNVYYNSETSKTANYTITIDIINSGGKDLFDITIIDSDLDYSENINLNRTQKHSYSENIILNKSASNKNKLFAKTNAVVNSIIYESNQINIQIPGYGGPADAIVNAPASVKSSNTFDTEITVLNMNEDIGQDFVINYWITNTDETKNYSSGEQTIYVAALGESKVIATLSAPSDIGEFRFKAIVSWVGGVATSYDTFVVETYSSKISGSSIIETPENFTEKDEKKEESGNETNLEKNNETEQGGVSKEKGLRFLFEETMKKYLQKINSIKEKIDKKYFIVYLFFVILLSSAIYFKYLFHGKQEKEIRLKSMKGLKVYGEDGADVGKIKKIYLEKNKPKIYGWVILLNKNLSKKIKRKKVLIRHKHVKSIKQIMILEEKVSEHLEKFDKKN